MNASQFLDIIQKADQLDKADMLQLKKVQENFPYFQIPHVLAARYDYLKTPGKNGSNLAKAAITSPDRVWLKNWLERPIPEVILTDPAKEDLLTETTDSSPNPAQRTESLKNLGQQLKEPKLNATAPKSEKPKAKKRPVPKEDLIESIKQKEKKAILDAKKKEQIDLIKAFSKKDIKLATIKEIEANQNTENLAEASTKLNDNLLSESFAKILLNQGKKGMAKEIYEKLALKFPEKKTYFADLIEKLKE